MAVPTEASQEGPKAEVTTPKQPGPSCRNHRWNFTPEEIQVISDCKRDAFLQRSLPLTVILGGGTYYAVRAGYFKANARFGAIPKVLVAAVAGYFLGNWSYRSTCEEKLRQLPNSHIGEMLRQRKECNFRDRFYQGFGPMAFGGWNPSQSQEKSEQTDASLPTTEVQK